ncbi:MAG: hypothetical protein ABMA25_00620 [Ilumatobacteraceae bacterium]
MSLWPMETTTGWRVLEPSPESWSARSFDALLAWREEASAAAAAAGIEVLLEDFDPLATNPLHVRALEEADDVVIVLDRSTFTLENAELVLGELQSPHPEVRHGFPFVGPDRVAFLYCHTGAGRGAPGAAQSALRGRGRWLGALSYSAVLDRQGDLARLALACPASVLEEMDGLVANLIPSLPPRRELKPAGRPAKRSQAPEGSVVVDENRVLRVFAGPAAPAAMSVHALQVFTLLEGWSVATSRVVAERLQVSEKEIRRTVKELVGLGLVDEPSKKDRFLAARPVLSDVRELREISRALAAGSFDAGRLVAAMRGVTCPAYGGVNDPVWAVHHGVGLDRGVPLARQADELLLGVAEQAARAGADASVMAEIRAALARAGVAVPQALVATSFPPPVPASQPTEVWVSHEPQLGEPAPITSTSAPLSAAAFEWPDPVWEATPVVVSAEVDEPEMPPVVPLVAPTIGLAAMAAAVAAVQPDAVATASRRLDRPRVLLRAFADGEATIVGARRPPTVQVPFALAAAQGARSAEGLDEAGVANASTLHKAFRTDDRELVIKERSSFMLADGVKTDYEWVKELSVEAGNVVAAGGDASWLIREAMNELDLFRGRCYPMAGKEQTRRWRWVDSWPDGATAVAQAEAGLTLAVVGLSTAWAGQLGMDPDLAGSAGRLVESMLRLERTVIPGWRAHVLTAAARVASASGRRAALDAVTSRVTQLAQNEAWPVPPELAEVLGW